MKAGSKNMFKQQNRRGSVTVYLVVMLPIVFLMASLAVDYGRAQTAKTQLQNAVDASIRAAGQELMNFQTNDTARATAIAVASGNRVDGSPVTLTASDVEFGTWDPNFKIFTANTASTNAIRISATRAALRGTAIPTLFSAVVGSNTVDVRASAIAYITQEIAPFNALGNVTFNQTGGVNGADWRTDSYIGNNNSYSSMTKRGNGHLAANGNVQYNFITPAGAQSGWANVNSNTVDGTIYTSGGQNCGFNWQCNGTDGGTYWTQYGGWGNLGASTQTMGSSISKSAPTMPTSGTNPTIPASYTPSSSGGLSNLVVADGTTVHLPAGTYRLNSISISNNSTVIFDGPVTLNVANNVSISDAAMMPQVNDPKYMVLNVCNSGGGANMNFSNMTQNLYADIDGPTADFNLTQGAGGNTVLGRIYAKNMTFNCTGTGGVHGNESLLMAMHIVK